MIKKQELKLKSDQDGLMLGVTLMIPDTKIKGIVQISHGMSEHRKRYYPWMHDLASFGYVCIIHDHRGHGESIRKKEDKGYFYDSSATAIVEDLHQLTRYIKTRFPDKKLILFGHSMGSLVVRNYLKKYDQELDRLIVCGSPSKNPFAQLGLSLARTLSKRKGDTYRSSFIQNLAFGGYEKRFSTSPNAWLCSDSKEVEKYEEDPLCGFVFTLNGFENLFQLMIRTYSKKGWQGTNKKLPILFIAGSEDPVITSEHKWKQAQEFLRQMGYQQVTGKLFPHMRHEILNETDKEQVYEYILDWIKE